MVTLVVDGDVAPLPPVPPELRMWTPRDLDIGEVEFARMAAAYSAFELVTATKPFLIRSVLDRFGGPVLYFDADQFVLGPLSDLVASMASGALVLTPHLRFAAPASDEALWIERTVFTAGYINTGLVGVPATARDFVAWWCERLARNCTEDPSPIFADQGWVTFAPGLFSQVHFPSPGFNVGWWSLVAQELDGDSSQPQLNGSPVRVLHFSGFDPENPFRFSAHDADLPRASLTRSPLLRELCSRYAAVLLGEGHRRVSRLPYGYARLSSGLKYDPTMRAAYRHALRRFEAGIDAEPPAPFGADGGTEFVRWLGRSPTGLTGLPTYARHAVVSAPTAASTAPAVSGLSRSRRGFAHRVRDGWPTELAVGALDPANEVEDRSGIIVVGERDAAEPLAGLSSGIVYALDGVGLNVHRLDLVAGEVRMPDVEASDPRELLVLVVRPSMLPYTLAVTRALVPSTPVAAVFWPSDDDLTPDVATALVDADRVWVPSRQLARLLLDEIGVTARCAALFAASPADPGVSSVEGKAAFVVRSTVDVTKGSAPAAFVVDAFQMAFSEGDGAQLNLVLRGATTSSRLPERLHERSTWRGDVSITATSHHPSDDYSARCDAFLSVRSGAAPDPDALRAMAEGGVVVTDAHCGNAEFMDADTAVLMTTPTVSTVADVLRDLAAGGAAWSALRACAASRAAATLSSLRVRQSLHAAVEDALARPAAPPELARDSAGPTATCAPQG